MVTKNKYEIKYKGKTYKYTGVDTVEVAEKFENRKVFGKPLVYGLQLYMYDSDTLGKKWAQYVDSEGKSVIIQISE